MVILTLTCSYILARKKVAAFYRNASDYEKKKFFDIGTRFSLKTKFGAKMMTRTTEARDSRRDSNPRPPVFVAELVPNRAMYSPEK